MKLWRRKQPFRYTFRGLREHDIILNPGSSLTIPEWSITIWCGDDGLLEFGPEMTDEQMNARADREISAKYGVRVKR